jgi:hypothetical protein
MSITPPARRRHALGLPAGSVRALLTFVVFGLLAGVLLLNVQDKVPQLYNYLWYLLLLIVAHFFAAHGNTIGGQADDRSPLGLPRGFFRILIIAGFVGLIAWLIHVGRLWEAPPETSIGYPAVLLAGFFLGVFVSRTVNWMTRGQGPPFWFQDIQAWLAIIAVLILGAQLLIQVAINPSVSEQNKIGESLVVESIFAAVVGFYFGARS